MKKRQNRNPNEEIMRQRMISQYVPLEILNKVLANLPVKSILRFRCVCKTWLSIIETPEFSTLQLTTFRNNVNEERIMELNKGVLRVRRRDTLEEISHSYPLNWSVWSRLNCFEIAAYINGVVLLLGRFYDSIFREEMFLWNPSIRKHIHLPRFRAMCSSNLMVSGLGFHSSCADYKVVAIVELIHSGGSITVVEVYSLNSNSWKRLARRIPCSLHSFRRAKVFVKGAVHWIARKKSYVRDVDYISFEDHQIVSFDIQNEVFCCFRLPEQDYGYRPEDVHLVAFGESLALLGRRISGRSSLWVMEKYGEADTWIRKYLMDIGMEKFLHLSKNGELLFVSRKKREVKSYDIVNDRMSSRFGASPVGRLLKEAYVESLVLANTKREATM